MHMIILAAGRGTRLRPWTDTRPKCLVELAGRPLLNWQMQTAAEAGIEHVVVVGGYRAEQLRNLGVTLVENPDYETTNMVHTLFCAEALFGDEFAVSYGDIAYDTDVLRTLLANNDPVAVVVDRQWRFYWEQRFDNPLSDAESLRTDGVGHILSIGQYEPDIKRIEAQYIGLMAFRHGGVTALRETFASAQADARSGRRPFGGMRSLQALFMTDLLQGMIGLGHLISAVPVDGGWVEIDSRGDLQVAERLIAEGRLGPA